MTSSNGRPALIVCPLRAERAWLIRAGIAPDVVCCCGPRQEGLETRLRSLLEPAVARDRPVVLAGLGGALHDGLAIGEALWASTVRATERPDASLTPPIVGRPSTGLVSSPTLVNDPAARAALATAHDASVVDMEASMFARLATELGAEWGVVRGISDGPRETLPSGVEHWVTSDGGTAYGALLRTIVCRPWLLASLPAMQQRGRHAMRTVATRLRDARLV